jgi:hypothetical protein
MQTKWDFAGSTDMWSTSAGGHLMKVVNLTGFTVIIIIRRCKVEDVDSILTEAINYIHQGFVYISAVLLKECEASIKNYISIRKKYLSKCK